MKNAMDMSSLMWSGLLGGVDPKGTKLEFNGKQVTINTAEHGYDKVINSMCESLAVFDLGPMDAILVFEGLGSKSQRMLYHSGYKRRAEKPPEVYHEFERLKAMLQTTWGNLGALSCQQDYAEADDTLAWLADNIKEDLLITTNDGDTTVLNKVNSHGARIIANISGVLGINKYGDFDSKYVTVYKALVGDSSDCIPGIKGFGTIAWNKLYTRFGTEGLDELIRMAESGSLDDIALEADSDKQLNYLYTNREPFLMSYRCAKLHPEWVNTMTYPIQWLPGMVKESNGDPRLRKWSQKKRLVTSAVWETFKGWAIELISFDKWITLDIETSTPPESDDWLAAQGKEDGVDVIGSVLTGMSLTFGRNKNYTVYIPVRHKDTENISSEELRKFLEQILRKDLETVIHNTQFEGTVLYNEWGSEWKDNGYNGLFPNWLDTKFEASYVDENGPLGLKPLSKNWLRYDQTDYLTTVTVDGIRHKMCELPATHVFDYACDDTITTSALHNFFKFIMQLEGTYEVYKAVEIDASYLHCQSFIHGTKISLSKLRELEFADEATYNEAEAKLHQYLINSGWDGSLPPTIEVVDAPSIKLAYAQVSGSPLQTLVRTPQKLYDMMQDQPVLVELLKTGDVESVNKMMAMSFTAKPVFNPGSPKQMQDLLYKTMGLPVKVYNKPTDTMRKAGIKQGTPKTDSLAVAYALIDAPPEITDTLKALKVMKMVQTRKSLYYSSYPGMVHWKTGRVHSSHNQCSTNTRRASSSNPNIQQLEKNSKVEGQTPRFREVFVPHKPSAVIVSMDFVSQEILLLAEWSRDPKLEAIFTADPPLDMHSMTGVGILNNQAPQGLQMSYDEFVSAVNDQHSEHYKLCKKYRALGKAINFSGQYRVAAPKMASMLFVTESEAQAMIDAKAEAFPVSEQWALDEMLAVQRTGVVTSLLGAVRHLGPAVTSSDRSVSSKADRQALSYRVQGSAAEMTKQAEGAMWRERLEQRFDCEIIGPVHDEVFASVAIADLYGFIPAMHKCMTRHYANMRMPIRSSISFGKSFGPADQIEVGNVPTPEAITEGLKELQLQLA